MTKIIHGDGVTDDTEAVQALLNGENVYWSDGTLFDGSEGKTHRITRTIMCDGNQRVVDILNRGLRVQFEEEDGR